jgi:hypothetical protein
MGMFTMGRTRLDLPEVTTVEQTGLPHGLIVDLVLKYVYFEGTVVLATIVERSKLSPIIVHAIHRFLLREQLCENRGMVGEDYEIALTNKGRAAAEVALKKSQYAGPAPVPLNDYRAAVKEQGLPVEVTAHSLRRCLSDLVLSDQEIHELGTALATGGAIMLYGGTGNGKTSIGERLHRIFDDTVYIPYAVEALGQVITIYDPLLHRAVPDQPLRGDGRWVLCHRPMVKVGGEMRAEMLEPALDEATRICVAPLQMKANNGVLLIDDFGRQRISPRELLNRWIVPLDRRTDIMSLWTGVSFEIPFEILVVFATNLSLTDLAEEAFLRRLRNKIKIDGFTPELFRELFRKVCRERNLTAEPDVEDHFLQECARRSPSGLRACYPHDILGIVCGMARFQQRTAVLDKSEIDAAMNVYFVH